MDMKKDDIIERLDALKKRSIEQLGTNWIADIAMEAKEEILKYRQACSVEESAKYTNT